MSIELFKISMFRSYYRALKKVYKITVWKRHLFLQIKKIKLYNKLSLNRPWFNRVFTFIGDF